MGSCFAHYDDGCSTEPRKHCKGSSGSFSPEEDCGSTSATKDKSSGRHANPMEITPRVRVGSAINLGPKAVISCRQYYSYRCQAWCRCAAFAKPRLLPTRQVKDDVSYHLVQGRLLAILPLPITGRNNLSKTATCLLPHNSRLPTAVCAMSHIGP